MALAKLTVLGFPRSDWLLDWDNNLTTIHKIFMVNLPVSDIQNSVLPQIEQNRIDQLKELTEPHRPQTDEELMSVSRQFEAIFVHQMLKSMRSTVQKSGFFDSHATRMYESMHDQEMANLMSEKRSIGLAEIVYKDLARLEEKMSKNQSKVNKIEQGLNPAIGFMG